MCELNLQYETPNLKNGYYYNDSVQNNVFVIYVSGDTKHNNFVDHMVSSWTND